MLPPIGPRPSATVPRALLILLLGAGLSATEWHCALDGDDDAAGTAAAPLRSPAAAEARAEPGDTIVVHGGVWRERFAPSRGGAGTERPITWRAAPGETVILSASEPATDWQPLGDGRWRLDLAGFDLADWNPYRERMKQGPLPGFMRQRSLGMVWVAGERTREVDRPEDVREAGSWAPSAAADAIVAHFGAEDPRELAVEISVREQVFSPAVWNLGHLVVEGFVIQHAANDYDHFFGKASSAPQHGALSTFGGHDWVIRGNTVRDCVALGIDFGLQGGASMEAHGVPERFGHHRLVDNRIERCGAIGAIAYRGPFCEIRGNVFVGNGWQDVGGHGKAALKLISSCVDSVVADNLFHANRGRGRYGYSSLWMDWAFQGSRISGNAFVDTDPVWIEASHGPTMLDANVFVRCLLRSTDGGGLAVVHNAFIHSPRPEIRMLVPKVRSMPIYRPHSLERIDKLDGAIQDHLVANNFFLGTDLDLPQDGRQKGQPVRGNEARANCYLAGARPQHGEEEGSARFEDGAAELAVSDERVLLTLELPAAAAAFRVPVADSAFIGQRNRHVEQALPAVEEDYLDRPFGRRPVPGPFADLAAGAQRWQLWPRE
ncbi:MAG: hypothetical protein ACOCYV_00920 [Planctomycetota bacterium]